MSYIVLARKYRPPNFDALVGQEHVVRALSNALTQQRLHHAYLFTGTRGVGKTTVSRILAKSLNCTGADGQGGITAHPCGVCDACRDIDAGRFVDYVELDAASNRGVDEISQLLDQAVYKPVLGRFKVYMIDEVHMLSNTAFNAMLKTLEEPPEYLKFVLATTDPQKVPPTVLSRCLQFNLRPMAPQTVQEHLGDILAREGIPAEPGALRLLARAARGSMRDGLSLTDQAIAFGAGGIAEDGVRQMLGAVDRGHAVRLIEALAAAQGAALLEGVDGLRGLGLSAAGALEEMLALLQQMAILQAVPEAVDLSDPEAAEAQRLAPLLAADETQLFYSIALRGRSELGLAPDEYSALTMLLLRMLAFRPGEGGAARVGSAGGGRSSAALVRSAAARSAAPAASAAPVVAAAVLASAPPTAALTPRPAVVASVEPAAAERARPQPAAARSEPDADIPPWMDAPFEHEATAPAASSAPTAPPVARSAVPKPAPVPEGTAPVRGTLSPVEATLEFERTPLGTLWADEVRALTQAGRISAFARELAMQAQCVQRDEQAERIVCRLRVEREPLRASGPVEKLRAALEESWGRPVQLEVEPGVAEDSPTRRDAAERARRQAQAEQIIHDDPLVQALMAQYKTARIVPGSVKPH